MTCTMPRLHDEAGSTSWLYERTTSACRALVEPARRASSTTARRALVELAWWVGYLVIWMVWYCKHSRSCSTSARRALVVRSYSQLYEPASSC